MYTIGYYGAQRYFYVTLKISRKLMSYNYNVSVYIFLQIVHKYWETQHFCMLCMCTLIIICMYEYQQLPAET